MLRSGGLLLIALLAGGLVGTSPVEGAGPKINDDLGSFFSKSAVDHAMGRLLKIYSDFKVEVVIETFSSIPDDMKAQYQPDAKAEFFRRWAVMRTDDERVNGIYVLICRNPGYLQIEPDKSTRKKAFTPAERNALAKKTLKLMDRKQFDAALAGMVDTIQSTLETNLGRRAVRPLRPQGGFLTTFRPDNGFPTIFRQAGRRKRRR